MIEDLYKPRMAIPNINRGHVLDKRHLALASFDKCFKMDAGYCVFFYSFNVMWLKQS